jgi:hypothetical protein
MCPHNLFNSLDRTYNGSGGLPNDFELRRFCFSRNITVPAPAHIQVAWTLFAAGMTVVVPGWIVLTFR